MSSKWMKQETRMNKEKDLELSTVHVKCFHSVWVLTFPCYDEGKTEKAWEWPQCCLGCNLFVDKSDIVASSAS